LTPVALPRGRAEGGAFAKPPIGDLAAGDATRAVCDGVLAGTPIGRVVAALPDWPNRCVGTLALPAAIGSGEASGRAPPPETPLTGVTGENTTLRVEDGDVRSANGVTAGAAGGAFNGRTPGCPAAADGIDNGAGTRPGEKAPGAFNGWTAFLATGIVPPSGRGLAGPVRSSPGPAGARPDRPGSRFGLKATGAAQAGCIGA
jgi:hypothetical protein